MEAHCRACGHPRRPEDRFCGGCGRALDGSAVDSLRKLRWLIPVGILAVGVWLIRPYLGAPGAPEESPPVATSAARVSPVPAGASTRAPATTGGGPAPTPGAPAAAPTTGSQPTPSVPLATPSTVPATPTPIVYAGAPIGPLKLEPRSERSVPLGRLEAGTMVRAELAIAFNSRLSSFSGVPDLDVQVVGPTGTLSSYPNAREGARMSFQAPVSGTYELRLDNSRSRINAKQVSVRFLPP